MGEIRKLFDPITGTHRDDRIGAYGDLYPSGAIDRADSSGEVLYTHKLNRVILIR